MAIVHQEGAGGGGLSSGSRHLRLGPWVAGIAIPLNEGGASAQRTHGAIVKYPAPPPPFCNPRHLFGFGFGGPSSGSQAAWGGAPEHSRRLCTSAGRAM